jgi:mannosyltransferase OCH1-like enzyme
MKYEKRIFSFWEPEGSLTPYLDLCRRTWERNLPDFEIIFLHYSNIGLYMPEGTYDMAVLTRLTPMMQKDAIMVAVLKEHGGVFIDADTLVTRDIAPLVRMLTEAEIVLFSTHLGFLAARPGSHILTLWYKGIQDKLSCLGEVGKVAPQLQWDFVGNSVLAEVMDKMIENLDLFRQIKKRVVDKYVLAYQKISRDHELLAPRLKTLMNRIRNSLVRRKREFYFRTIFRRYLIMLDRIKYGFIPETFYFTSKSMMSEEKYWKFWFDNSIDIRDVFKPHQMVIGLHNSWTPQWYKELSEKEVLENGSLLSRTLKYLLT